MINTETPTAELQAGPKPLARLLVTEFFFRLPTTQEAPGTLPNTAPPKLPPEPPAATIDNAPDTYDSNSSLIVPEAPEALPAFEAETLTQQLIDVNENLTLYTDEDIEQAVLYCLSQFRELGLTNEVIQQQYPTLHEQFMKLYNLSRTRSSELKIIEPTPTELVMDSARNQQTVIDIYTRLIDSTGQSDSPPTDSATVQRLQLPATTQVTDIQLQEIQGISRQAENPQNSVLINVLDQLNQAKTWAINHKGAIAFLVAMDAILFKGNYSYALANTVGSITSILNFAGMDVKPSHAQKEVYLSAMLAEMNTHNLFDFMNNRQPHELYAFLEDIGKDTRDRIFTGKSFGGTFQSRHQFSTDQVQTLLKHLTSDQLRDLKLEQYIAKDQAAT